MKKIIWHILYFPLILSILHSESLLDKYKKKINETHTYTNHEVSKNGDRFSEQRVKSIVNEIEKIQSFKKSTFESSQEFRKRRDEAIDAIDDKTAFYFKKGSEEYSAGTVKMKHYDPDTEIIVVTLEWNRDVAKLFSRAGLVKTASFSIPREEAKRLFENSKKHFFHIKFMYEHDQIIVSEILLYNQYSLYRNINKTVLYADDPKPKAKSNVEEKPILPKCKSYEVVASRLNIRNEPSKRSEILGSVKKGESVCVYEFHNGWARTDYGWISKSYVKNRPVEKKDVEERDGPSSSSSRPKAAEKSSSGGLPWWVWVLIIFFVLGKFL